MAANNFRVHTDANYRIRDDIAPLMQSSRSFNSNNCMQSRSLRRNIISDHFVQPYTKKFDDGSCDYNVARESELKIGNHNYYSRPQNYEAQLGLTQDNMKATNNNSKLDQAYNLVGSQLPPISGNQSSDYYPYAYGNNLTGVGAGVMGGFNQAGFQGNTTGSNPGYYEPYTYKPSSGSNQVLRSGGESNFGQYNPKNTSDTTPTHAGYNANLSYRNINPARRSYAGTSPKTRSIYSEGFQQRPREGFFFESGLYPVNNYGGDYQEKSVLMASGGPRSLKDLEQMKTNTENSIAQANEGMQNLITGIQALLNPNESQIQNGAHVLIQTAGKPTPSQVTAGSEIVQNYINSLIGSYESQMVNGQMQTVQVSAPADNEKDREVGFDLDALNDELTRVNNNVIPELEARLAQIQNMIDDESQRSVNLVTSTTNSQQQANQLSNTRDTLARLGLPNKYIGSRYN